MQGWGEDRENVGKHLKLKEPKIKFGLFFPKLDVHNSTLSPDKWVHISL